MGILKKIFDKILGNTSVGGEQDAKNYSVEKEVHTNIKFYRKMGLHFNNEVRPSDLKKNSNWEDWEMDSLTVQEFRYYFFLLSGTSISLKEPYTYEPLSSSIWYFDYERDEDVKYGDFILRMNGIADNTYPFKEVTNIIEPPFGVSFRYQNKEYKWMFKHQRDWADEHFFTQLIDLTAPETNKKKFYILTEGQGGVIVFLEPKQVQKLETFLGLKIGAFDLLK